VLWSGNSTSGRDITGYGFAPDFAWVKNRTTARNHQLYDTVRGANKGLQSNTTNAEDTSTTNITAFISDGFTVGNDNNVNSTGDTFVGWGWNAGGSNATNTSGTITSTVRANTTAGFSIVTWTGNGTNATVGHGLGAVPSMIIVKRRDTGASGWSVYFTTLAAGNILSLQSTAASTSSPTRFTTTLPTSTVFSIGTDSDLNANGGTYVAYCFAAVAGYSAFGSYAGNGSTDGPFIYLGFRPRWVMIKRTDSTNNWVMYDTSRDTYNAIVNTLAADSANSESTFGSGYNIDFLSNGFKPRNTTGAQNASGGTYIYAAFAESPFKYALAR
jgi:hypothetical protein